MEKLLAVFLHFQIILVNRNGFEELLLTFDPSQEQMIEVSRFQNLKILKRFVVPWTCGLILLAEIAGYLRTSVCDNLRRGPLNLIPIYIYLLIKEM